ncbi:MAG: cyclase [Herpetosiphonaceae bacterium]|nr:MAG: cyclase [Herpetosiphonaceae bacterium]
MISYIDITLTITNALPVWPGDPPIALARVASFDSGDQMNLSRLEGSVHVGTHVDAPLHFIPNGKAIDQLDLDRFVGPCYVAELAGEGLISAAELERAAIPEGVRRLLLKTSNSAFWEMPTPRFREDFRALSVDAAEWLVGRHLLLIGIDALSIEPFDAEPGHPVHRTLLQAEVAVVEGLRLANVQPGHYQLLCLPLKLGGSDGAPARAILAPLA